MPWTTFVVLGRSATAVSPSGGSTLVIHGNSRKGAEPEEDKLWKSQSD